MKHYLPRRRRALWISTAAALAVLATASLAGATTDVLGYVNPFIGTTRTSRPSPWGGEGNTYPGAVAPFGYIQITPETRNSGRGGYDWRDSTIVLFSCLGHRSGFPGGSSGQLAIMPVTDDAGTALQAGRLFHHQDEQASPGYYRLRFRDDGTLVEAAASERTGMFRLTFAAGVIPRIYVGRAGKLRQTDSRSIASVREHAVIQFSEAIAGSEPAAGGGLLLNFLPAPAAGKQLLIRLSASTTSPEGSRSNLDREAPDWNFDRLRAATAAQWRRHLAVITVDDSSESRKTIFYTALYHASLLPMIISDSDGRYRGRDGQVRQARGQHQYGIFSPWDTFRSQHPLLALIAPQRQQEMILSMLDMYEQGGCLPRDTMTGAHALPIILDSWMKGIRGFDSTLAFSAMRASVEPPCAPGDMTLYDQLGYIPATFSESVTRTVEYAYNDWCLAEFARQVMGDDRTAGRFYRRSHNWRHLLDPASLFLVPRQGEEFLADPGTLGYKEGDQWIYSYFVPHDPAGLISHMGGSDEFAGRLDAALEAGRLPFDNEPLFHIPWLFNYAGKPGLTHKWVHRIMAENFTTAPDGLPGNDDLGSLSSWYVLGAMGLYPLCPGRPGYDLSPPLFRRLTLHHPSGQKIVIMPAENLASPAGIRIHGENLAGLWISHEDLLNQKSGRPRRLDQRAASDVLAAANRSDIRLAAFHASRQTVAPDELFYLHYELVNHGADGAHITRLYADGRELARKSRLVAGGTVVHDSIACRLYALGEHRLRLGSLPEEKILVTGSAAPRLQVTALQGPPLLRAGAAAELHLAVKNSGGGPGAERVEIRLDGRLWRAEPIRLEAGASAALRLPLVVDQPGWHELKADAHQVRFRVYVENREARRLDLSLADGQLLDQSGFANRVVVRGDTVSRPWGAGFFRCDSGRYLEMQPSPSLDSLGEKITIMAWVRPAAEHQNLADIIAKRDFNVLQINHGRWLNFFAGGWGRGACAAPLPADWTERWHHLAGVCSGQILRLYIDGRVVGEAEVGPPVTLAAPGRWTIGRSEEFPNERFFTGLVAQVRIFAAALTPEEVMAEMGGAPDQQP